MKPFARPVPSTRSTRRASFGGRVLSAFLAGIVGAGIGGFGSGELKSAFDVSTSFASDAPRAGSSVGVGDSPQTSGGFCDLAGLRETFDFDVSDAFATPTRFARFAQNADFLNSPEPSRVPEFIGVPNLIDVPDLSPTPRVVRGGNLSELAIDPFRGRVFGNVDASWAFQEEQNDASTAPEIDISTFGGGAGQDWRLGENGIWGYGVQARQVEISPRQTFFDSTLDSFAGFLHMGFFGPLWRFDLAAGASKRWHKETRNDFVNKFSSTQWFYEAELGVRYDKGYTRIEPFLNARVLTLREPAAAEKFFADVGGPREYSDDSYRLKLGSRFSWEYETRFSTLTPYLVAGWSHDFGARALFTVGETSPFPVAFRYGRQKSGRDRLDLAGGVDAALRESVDLFFRYDFEVAQGYVGYLVFAGFNKKY